MDEMINSELVKALRKERSWSQEQLAAISGISHRTVQRIENEGACSLDSIKGLAVAFEIEAVKLTIDKAEQIKTKANQRGRIFGLCGTGLGILGAYIGITVSLLANHITYGEAGMYYGSIGALGGISFAMVGVFSHRLSTS